MSASSGTARQPAGLLAGRGREHRHEGVLDGKHDDTGQATVRTSGHPLPWRNQPSGGENHVADANGRPVYDGTDAAEMFRLYSDEAQAARAERPPDGRHRAADSRTGRRRARRTT